MTPGILVMRGKELTASSAGLFRREAFAITVPPERLLLVFVRVRVTVFVFREGVVVAVISCSYRRTTRFSLAKTDGTGSAYPA